MVLYQNQVNWLMQSYPSAEMQSMYFAASADWIYWIIVYLKN